MTTHVYSLAEEIGSRLTELDNIVGKAESVFGKDDVLYDILCRAGCVLAVSALEGFLKELNTAVQSDLNANIATFSGMPKNMQREFSRKIVYFNDVPEAEIQKRTGQLIKFFHANSVNIEMGAFNYKEHENKNPSANMVDGLFSKYGINSVLHCLSGSKFEVVFDNDSATDLVLRREIRRMRATLYKFPYRELPSKFKMEDWTPVKGQSVPTSIWHTFLENLLIRRHGIVHADTRSNPISWYALKEDSKKLEILFHGVLFALSSFISKDVA